MVSWTHPGSTGRKPRKPDALAIQLPSSSHLIHFFFIHTFGLEKTVLNWAVFSFSANAQICPLKPFYFKVAQFITETIESRIWAFYDVATVL